MDRTGESVQHQVIVDTEQRTVNDNTVQWRHGQQRPGYNGTTDFVRIDDNEVAWGDERLHDEVLDLFSIQLLTGRYSWSDPKNGIISHGTCAAPPKTG